jgi:hypothetical protein
MSRVVFVRLILNNNFSNYKSTSEICKIINAIKLYDVSLCEIKYLLNVERKLMHSIFEYFILILDFLYVLYIITISFTF